MAGKAMLLDVFEISGRGCVVAVEAGSTDCRAGDQLCIGEHSWEITGIDIPRYSPEALGRMEEGWVPPIGLLLKGAAKHELVELIGHKCHFVDGKAG